MKGGKPGYFPDFDDTPDQLPHWIGLNLWDPFKARVMRPPSARSARTPPHTARRCSASVLSVGACGVLWHAVAPRPHPPPSLLSERVWCISAQFCRNQTPAEKAKGLITEINNGRLAMIGIMGFCAEQKVPGSVPWGPHLKEYAGDFMQPF